MGPAGEELEESGLHPQHPGARLVQRAVLCSEGYLCTKAPCFDV